MKKLFALLVCLLILFALASCGDDPCSHRDADDNSLCDNCGESYTDGKDIDDSTPCSHRDADDNSLCDNCGEAYTDGKDVSDSTPCQHRDADDDSLCDNCGTAYTDGNDSTEHIHEYNQQNTDSTFLASAANCTNAATYYYSCACGAKGTATFANGDALGHSYTVQSTDAVYLASAANCTNAATYYYSCACGAKGEATFASGDALGHSYTVQSTDAGYLASAANCTSAAAYFCSCACGAKGEATFASGDALGHSYTVQSTDAGYLASAANCTNAATYFYSCSCGAKGTTTFTNGSANGHSYTVESTDIKYRKSPATTESPAIYWKSCACGKASTTETFTSYSEGLLYTYDNLSNTYVVAGIGDCSEMHISIPPTYKGCSVVEISNAAFKGCVNLKTIIIPDSITSISDDAFESCSNLVSITIPKSVTRIGQRAFRNCSNLTSITIPDNVTFIGQAAFAYCSNLVSINLPNGLTSIEFGLFAYCFKLASVDDIIHKNITTIGDAAFLYCSSITNLTIPDRVTAIGINAFSCCSSLVNVTIGNGVTSIGDYAFSACSSLTSVDFSENSKLTSIGDYAFRDCTSLTSVTIPDSVTSIGSYAFRGCTSLTNAIIGNKVSVIGSSAFTQCESLVILCKATNKPSGWESIWYDLSTPVVWGVISKGTTGNGFEWANTQSGLVITKYSGSDTVVDIPNTINGVDVTSILEKAFYQNTAITSLTIPNSVKNIGKKAFCNCLAMEKIYFNAIAMNDLSSYNLVFYNVGNNGDGTKVIIGKNVTKIPAYLFESYNKITSVEFEKESLCESIGNSAFAYCSNLVSIKIPSNVTQIGDSAFSECVSLTSIFIPKNVINWGSSVFYNCNALKRIEFPGTASEFKQIVGAGSYLNDKVVFVCNTCTPDDTVEEKGTDGTYYSVVYCKNCKREIERKEIIHTHSFVVKNAIEANLKNEATCKAPATYYYSCSCGAKGSNAFSHIGFGDHTYANGVCTNCGLRCSKGLEFISYNNGTCLVKIGECDDTVIVIPPMSPNGDIVIAIGYGGFYSAYEITEVVIPSTVTKIDDMAFSGCSALESITIGNAVTSIGYMSFADCKSLKNIVIPDSVNKIGEYAFSNCTGIVSVTIGNGVTSIGNWAFSSCNSLSKVNITDIAAWCNISFGNSSSNPISIAGKIYFYDELITNLVISENITAIEKYAFYGCTSITKVSFKQIDGWWRTSSASSTSGTNFVKSDLSNTLTAATYLTSTYTTYYWKYTQP